jgi:DnaK suppressor protein
MPAIDHYRQHLLDALAATEASQAEAGEASGTVMLDQSSVGRLSRMDAMQQQAMA